MNEQKITNREMDILAENLELYLQRYTEVYIIPPNLLPREGELAKAINKIRKLIKKLKEHDVDAVFGDIDELDTMFDE